MIYIHVGMHKTGTTFLQNDIFPRVKGLTYCKPGTPLDAYLRLDPSRTCLISNERLAGRLWATMDQVETSIKRLSEFFPQARIIMSFRPHDGFIVSSYKQYLHQGGCLSFSAYFDFKDNCGFMKREQFLFAPRIKLVSQYFERPPFVFLLEELINSPQSLFSELGNYIGADFQDCGSLVSTSINKGVTLQQAKVLRWLNQFDRTELNPNGRWKMQNIYTRMLRLYPRALVQFWLCHLPDGPFLQASDREAINEFYTDDWKCVMDCKNARATLLQ